MTLPSVSHPKLWLAVLREIDQAGGSIQPKVLYPRLLPYFPEITNEDLQLKLQTGGSKWTNRVQWVRQRMVESGLLAKTPGQWTITPAGQRWLKANWKGASFDYAGTAKPALATSQIPKTKAPAQTTAPTPLQQTVPGQIQPLKALNPLEDLCQQLLVAQRQSVAPQNYEKALREAFAMLGFESEHIGGSGETDIYLRASMGSLSYSVVIDAKSTHSGKVPDAQINWPVRDSHRQSKRADFAAVVGESFSGGQLQKFAAQYDVTLIKTETLCELLRLHAITPFSLIELRDVFKSAGTSEDGLKSLAERHNQHVRLWQLVSDIVDVFDELERKAAGGFSAKVDQLQLVLTTRALMGNVAAAQIPTQDEATSTVALLSNPAVGILAEVPGSGGAFQLVMRGRTARKRLAALSRAFENSARVTQPLPHGISLGSSS